MALTYYDDVLAAKLKRWMPDNMTLRILKPDEVKRLLELRANDENDQELSLPMLALSRSSDIELLSNVKQSRSFDGLKIFQDAGTTMQMNVIPVRLTYQIDLYTKTYEEGDELLREYLFKLINNPTLKIDIPYNGAHIEHIANIRVASNVADTSSIAERLFPGQFTRWTINLELQDAFLFNLPYRKN